MTTTTTLCARVITTPFSFLITAARNVNNNDRLQQSVYRVFGEQVVTVEPPYGRIDLLPRQITLRDGIMMMTMAQPEKREKKRERKFRDNRQQTKERQGE